MNDTLLYVIAAVMVLGIAAQWLSWRLRVPAILALLVIGIVAGPVTGLLRPDAMFGDILFPMVSLGVALVLFEGGLTLRFSDLRGHGAAVSNLVSWGALLNWVLIAVGTCRGRFFGGNGPVVCRPGGGNRPDGDQPAAAHHARHARGQPVAALGGHPHRSVGALLAVLVFQFISRRTESYLLFLQSIGVGVLAARSRR